jgi:hypothetical protein
MLISEVQTATVSLSAQVLGMPPALAAYTIDTSHTPAYGLGYICKKAQPKVCVATHYSYDDIFNNETVAEVRHCEITDLVGPSCHLRVGDGQGGLNDPRTTRDSSKEANP